MKLMFLTNIPSPYRVEFFNELGKYCDLTVIFERKTSDERDSKWYNNNFKYFKTVFLRGLKIQKNKALSFEIVKFLDANIFDAFVIGGYSTPTAMLAIEVLKAKKIPFIINTDGGIINNDSFVRFLIKKHFLSSATHWLSTGEVTNKYLLHYGAVCNRIFEYPFTSLRNSEILKKPISHQEKLAIKEELNMPDCKIIIAIGQFIYRKGFDVLLNACSKISGDYELYIIGGEPTTEYLRIVNELCLDNIKFIDFMKKRDLVKFYLASDIFVLPTREDIWGLVVNEAMSLGLPVISTENCVAGVELIEDGINGFIVPVEDSNLLADRINRLLSNPELCSFMGKNNLIKMQDYTIEKMAEKIYGFIKST